MSVPKGSVISVGQHLDFLGIEEQSLILRRARKLDPLTNGERVDADQVLLDGRIQDRLQDGSVSVSDDARPGTVTVDFKVTCDRCGRAWVFTVTELTEHHDELSRRVPPVALAGVDVGRPVGG